ncbi:AI-2E family transporter [Planctomicrobium sp. SH527]|uniref:AI-2E family transporter n=1 Tax=Planctomicrobium sp. SH527 TaxID=3448123 RepID=UPI003F5B8191
MDSSLSGPPDRKTISSKSVDEVDAAMASIGDVSAIPDSVNHSVQPLTGIVVPQAIEEKLDTEVAAREAEELRVRREYRLFRFQQIQTIFLGILAFFAVVGVLHQARAVMLPVTLAVLSALALRPIVRKLRRWKLPDPVGAGLIILLILAVTVLGTIRLSDPAKAWLHSFPENVDKVKTKLANVASQFKPLSDLVEQYLAMTSTSGGAAGAPVTVEIAQSRISTNISLLANTSDFITSLLLVIGLTYFFLAFGDTLLNNLLRLLGSYSDKKRTVELVYDVERGIASYLSIVTAINLGLGVATGIVLWVMGLPNPALWGVLIFALNYIPVFGALVGVLVIALISMLTFDSLIYAMVAPLVFLLLSAIEGNLVTPSVLGRSMSLNPILVFLALIFGGWLWGVGGAFLAVPMLAIAKIACERFEQTKPIATMVSA